MPKSELRQAADLRGDGDLKLTGSIGVLNTIIFPVTVDTHNRIFNTE